MLKRNIEKDQNVKIKMLGKGAFSYCYENLEDDTIVYIAAPQGNKEKEIYNIMADHGYTCMPTYEHIGAWDGYDVYKTERSASLKPNTLAYQQAKIIVDVVNEQHNKTPIIDRVDVSKKYAFYADAIESMRKYLPSDICDALECLNMWASDYVNQGKEFYGFDLHNANFGVRSDGTLILRDVIAFIPIR